MRTVKIILTAAVIIIGVELILFNYDNWIPRKQTPRFVSRPHGPVI
jgi:hypothetical protein